MYAETYAVNLGTRKQWVPAFAGMTAVGRKTSSCPVIARSKATKQSNKENRLPRFARNDVPMIVREQGREQQGACTIKQQAVFASVRQAQKQPLSVADSASSEPSKSYEPESSFESALTFSFFWVKPKGQPSKITNYALNYSPRKREVGN